MSVTFDARPCVGEIKLALFKSSPFQSTSCNLMAGVDESIVAGVGRGHA